MKKKTKFKNFLESQPDKMRDLLVASLRMEVATDLSEKQKVEKIRRKIEIAAK